LDIMYENAWLFSLVLFVGSMYFVLSELVIVYGAMSFPLYSALVIRFGIQIGAAFLFVGYLQKSFTWLIGIWLCTQILSVVAFIVRIWFIPKDFGIEDDKHKIDKDNKENDSKDSKDKECKDEKEEKDSGEIKLIEY